MKYWIIAGLALLILLPCPLLSQGKGSSDSRIEAQVVGIFATKESGPYNKPWRSPNFRSVRGSGFFFQGPEGLAGNGGLILTNAHVVEMAQKIEISNGREKRRYDVKLLGICHLADFAVLQMEPGGLEVYEKRNGRIVPLKLGDSDRLRVGDKVLGWGYPLGGERISKSEEGEINRIEVRRYAYSHERWLMVQASLQQNPGNSGGPIFKGNKVVGIAFQGIRASDRINYFIPINLVKRLMPLLPHQEKIPRWRFTVQHLYPRLKDYYGLGSEEGGLLVNYVIPDGGPHQFGLRANDILMGIDGFKIDDFGDIFFEPLEQRISFQEILNRKTVGDPLAVKVMRDGEVLDIHGYVTPGLPWLVPKIFTQANYFIYGGIGFVELTFNSIGDLGKVGYSLKERFLRELPEEPHQKVVIVMEIFPEYGLMNTGPYMMKRVEKINGEDVLNIEHLFNTVKTAEAKGEKRAIVALSKNIQFPMDLEQAEKLGRDIQKKYGILYMKTPGGFAK